jgi:hypothetical protein
LQKLLSGICGDHYELEEILEKVIKLCLKVTDILQHEGLRKKCMKPKWNVTFEIHLPSANHHIIIEKGKWGL